MNQEERREKILQEIINGYIAEATDIINLLSDSVNKPNIEPDEKS